MAQKRATYITYDDRCDEVRKFIEDAGVILQIRDMKENPLSVRELKALLGYIPAAHFLNEASATYKKHGFDKELPERNELFSMIAEDYTLLRKPIIKTLRLVTIGCNKQKIGEMLQINSNQASEPVPDVQPPRRNPRRSPSGARR
ncbi:MAG: hypothetical protein DRP45_02040 [Candidatus Zixiibacteriota bacterium]|nr:MAG: hypothetical protein DRP45_02040 [candidate division Zixibacteria bacterium]